MKKFAFLFVVGLFLVSGCGKGNKVVCTGTESEEGMTVETKIEAEIKDDKVSSVSATMKFDSEETAKSICDFFALANQMSEDESEKLDYSCNGKEIKIKNYDAMETEDSKVVGMSKSDFIANMEKESLTCK